MVSSDSESSSSSNSSKEAELKQKKHAHVDKKGKSHEHQSRAEDRISSKFRELERISQKPEKSKGSGQNAMQRLEQEQSAPKPVLLSPVM
uniref:Small acidic protein-like domain-containing protein n=1 Tax=Ditylenchus dipsaci TaxID=166011 RepID=A0A915EJ24_9BILA